MTEREGRVARFKIDVLNAESRLREAQRNYEEGSKLAEAKLKQAEAEKQKEVSRLLEEMKRAKNAVDTEICHLKEAETALEKGFDD